MKKINLNNIFFYVLDENYESFLKNVFKKILKDIYNNKKKSKIILIVDKKVFNLHEEKIFLIYKNSINILCNCNQSKDEVISKKRINNLTSDKKNSKSKNLSENSNINKSNSNNNINNNNSKNNNDNLTEMFNKNTITIEVSESRKTLSTYETIIEKFLKMNIDRNSIIIGIGGGIITDITGFIANTYKRGVNYGFIPTTLLAMGDAAIGGKNGLNYKEFKNIIGTINNPDFLIYDIEFLETLKKRDLFSGFYEILKYGLIYDFKFLEDTINFLEKALYTYEYTEKEFFKKNEENIYKFIKKSIEIKLNIVNKDFYDKGVRHILNFGHTFAHAFEKYFKGELTHGEAVLAGMIISIVISDLLYVTNYMNLTVPFINNLKSIIGSAFIEEEPLNPVYRELINYFDFMDSIDNINSIDNKEVNIDRNKLINLQIKLEPGDFKKITKLLVTLAYFHSNNFTKSSGPSQVLNYFFDENGYIKPHKNFDKFIDEILEIISNDKKIDGDFIDFVILKELGKAEIVKVGIKNRLK